MRGIAETTGACRICLGLIIFQFRRLCIGRLHLASQDKGDHVTVAGGTHPSHEVVITCMGLRQRRAGRCRSARFRVFADEVDVRHDPCDPNSVRLGPHESWHGVPHGALLSGTHPYPCNYSLYANFFSASRTRRKTKLHAAIACPLIPRASELATACRQQAATAAKCKP